MTKVAIIGAGPCGLSMLRSFEQAEKKGEKIPQIVCFDKQEDWGGLWNYSWRTGSDQYGDPVPNSMYRYLWSNGPKECLEFADYSFDEHFKNPIPSFPPREVLYDYILGRVKKGNIKDKIKFNTKVTNVIYNSDKFEISYQNKTNGKILKDNFDYVVVSTGHFSVPFIPEYKGMDSFPGRIMHSHDFRDAEEFRDKNVIVLGSSYSAEDIALQCNKYGAKSVTIGYRHNPMGFKWPKGMKEVYYLDRLEGKKAIFKDGTEQEADVILLCTGYLHHFPFLEEKLKLEEKKKELREEIKLERERAKDIKLFLRKEQAIIRKEQAKKQRKFLEELKIEKQIEKFRVREIKELEKLEKISLKEQREDYAGLQERIEKLKAKYRIIRDQKIRERVEALGVQIQEGDDREILLQKEREYLLERQKIENCLESFYRSASSLVFQLNKRHITRHMSIFRCVDRRFETGEIFIKWDEAMDDEWLLLIYIKNNSPDEGVIIEDKSDPEKNATHELKTNEIFKASDLMVDSLTQLLAREREKNKQNQ